jgi:transposase, IS5 family
VFRTIGEQPTLWDAVLPEELLALPAELARVDALLDDPAFFAPLAPFFDPTMGRPSIPMESYLRLMFLKFPTGWGSRVCAGRCPIRSHGGGSPGSASTGGCRTRPP